MARLAVLTAALALAAAPAAAGEIRAERGNAGANRDLVGASVSVQERWLRFRLAVAGAPWKAKPEGRGRIAAFLWPVDIDPDAVGFDFNAGLLALAVEAHPGFDDTPLADENADDERGNDGGLWHSHWVILVEAEDACGGGYKVKPAERGDDLPATWPGGPVQLASPGYSPVVAGSAVDVRAAFKAPAELAGEGFGAVSATLARRRQAPRRCVTGLHDVAGGELAFPGTID